MRERHHLQQGWQETVVHKGDAEKEKEKEKHSQTPLYPNETFGRQPRVTGPPVTRACKLRNHTPPFPHKKAPPPPPCPLHSFLLRSGEPASGSPMPGSPLCSSLINSPLKQHTHSQRLSVHRQPLWSSLAAAALSSADTLGAADCQRRTEIESTRHSRQPLSRSS